MVEAASWTIPEGLIAMVAVGEILARRAILEPVKSCSAFWSFRRIRDTIVADIMAFE